MKIGIYKPYKKIYFDESDEDTSSWSLELVNLAKILAKHNHEVYITSPTEYNESIENIYSSSLTSCPQLDVMFVSNGVFKLNDISEKKFFEMIKHKVDKKILLETDLTLSLNNHTHKLYTKIFSQSQKENVLYTHLEKLALYNSHIQDNKNDNRNIDLIFIGHERDRLKKFLEYVNHPQVTWFGKSDYLKINNKISKKQLPEILSNSKTSIVFSGDIQNQNGFVSQRYFENCLYGVINFVDADYDKDGLIISHNDWRRVRNFDELRFKSKVVCQDTGIFNHLQQRQFDEIKPYLDGELIYNKIMENLECENKN